jgi:hypothetical protein
MLNEDVRDANKNNRFMLDVKGWLNFAWDVANVLWPLPTGAGQTMVSHQNARQQQAAQPAIAKAKAVLAQFGGGGGDSASDGGSGSTGSSSTRGSRSDRQRVAEKMRECILKIDSLLFSDGRCKFSSSNNYKVLLKMSKHLQDHYMTREYRALHERNQLAAERNQLAAERNQLAADNARLQQRLASNQALANRAPGVVDDESEEKEHEV